MKVMPSILTPEDLQTFMDVRQIWGEILRLSVPTPTVETAAQAVGCRPEQIVKSILFTIDDQPVLAIACGTAPVARRAIADQYGVGRKRVKLAPPEVVLALSGFEVGAMPPFGHRQPLPTLLDPAILEHTEVYAGGGAENALARLHPADILRVTQAKMVTLTQPAAASSTLPIEEDA
jgi:prolyl-tRNA editing enzyme YbaK/EbsC (Cys-tRNA(Pro) deacylase)